MEELFVAQERASMNMLMTFPMLMSASSNTAEVMKTSFSPIYCGFRKGRCYICGHKIEFIKLEENGKMLVRENPEIITELIDKFAKKQHELIDYCKKNIFLCNLSKKTNEEILDIFNNYFSKYYNAFPYGEPITWATRFTLVEELKEKIAEKVPKNKLIECISILISPNEQSFVNKEELALLKIVKLIQENEEKRKQFESGSLKELDKHTQKFEWVPFDNGSTLWDKKHFINSIKEHLDTDIDKRIKKISSYTKEIKEKKRKILDELNLDKETEKLFEAVAQSGYLQDLKKELASYTHYLFMPWMVEFSRRFDISHKQSRYLTPKDVEEIIHGKKPNKEILDERYKLSVFVSKENSYEIWTGKKAEAFFKNIDLKNQEQTAEIQGVCASPGSLIGKARVLLSATEIKHMQKEEILITTMTTPDFVPAMKKAKGVITEEGGLTCHAAVVSRELGIPCVVGAQNVTKLINTGDLVEIHGASGVIRKLGGKK